MTISVASLPLAVQVQHLSKTFGAQTALDDLELKIPQGQIHAVLGPNGAGKTTLLRILTTLLRPTSGQASILGCDVVTQAASIRGRISSTGQSASLDEDLTGLENLILLARLLGHRGKLPKRRATSLLMAFGLTDASGRQVRKYSGGMRRRLDIAASLLAIPEVLFLDEPTTGLDPRSRNQVWEIIRVLVHNGTTVMLTTQHLEEADQLADHITVIDAGRIVAQGTPGQLKALVGTGVLRVRLLDPAQHNTAVSVLTSLLGATAEIQPDASMVQLRIRHRSGVAAAVAELDRRGIDVGEFSLDQPSLDEVFLALTAQEVPAQKEKS